MNTKLTGRCLTIALAIALTSRASLSNGGQLAAYSQQVVLENTGGLSNDAMNLIASELPRRFRRSAEERANRIETAEIASLADVTQVALAAQNLGGPNGLIFRSLSIQAELPSSGYDERLLAQKWEKVRGQLQVALRAAQARIGAQAAREHDDRLRDVELRRDLAARQLDEAIVQIEALSQQGSPEQLRGQLMGARATLNELALNRVGAEARREAIVAQIDELRAKGEHAAASDPLIEEFEKIVAIREQQLEHVRLLHKKAVVAADEVDKSEAELATARVEVLKAKRAAMAESAGSVVQELNNELSRLIVQLAEIDARSKAMQEQVEKLRAATSVSNTTRAEQLNHRLLVLQRRVAELEEAKAELESKAPPAVEEITITPLDEALSLTKP